MSNCDSNFVRFLSQVLGIEYSYEQKVKLDKALIEAHGVGLLSPSDMQSGTAARWLASSLVDAGVSDLVPGSSDGGEQFP